MIVILSRETVIAPSRLVGKAVPRLILGRQGLPIPRGTVRHRAFWRALVEMSLPRYIVALLPFVVAMILRPDWALALAQAPLPMFALVYLVETRVLAIPSPESRRKQAEPAEIARTLDLLTARGRQALARIAAGRGLSEGSLSLVVEQSPLARIAPLTILSVQDADAPSYLDLRADERALLARLFGDGLDERTLQRVNQAEERFVRVVTLEARSVSAHARLAALAARRPG